MIEEMAICENPLCDKGEDGSPAEFVKWPTNKKYCSVTCKKAVERTASRQQYVQDVAAAVAKVYDLDVPDPESQINYLRSENKRLTNLAEKYKNSKYELVDALYKGAFDALKELEFEPIKAPKASKDSKDCEVAVSTIADLQLGKVSLTYNSEVCAERIDLYGDKVVKLTEIQRSDHPVNELRVWLLGDLVEGEGIFASQAHLLDRSLYAQVVKDGPQILGSFLRKMLGIFSKIKVTGVIGNHGVLKGRRDFNNETNMDRMLYKVLEHMFAYEPRISFNIPDGYGERSFYAVDAIGKHKTLLIHGDQFPPPNSLHAYQKKIMAWKAGGISEDFDEVYGGHFHQALKATFGSTIFRMAGSTESYNTYASELLGVMGRPSQPLQFVHPNKGVTAEYQLYLD